MARGRGLTGAGALAAAAAAGAAGAAGTAAFAAHRISGPRRPWPAYGFTPFEVGVPSEDVEFTAADGTRLAGWWFDRPGSDRVVICCHGHRGNKADMLGIGPGLWRAGSSVLLFDFRGNGESTDGPQSLAHYEQLDLRAAVDLVAARRPDADIQVVGFSMGAAVAILTAADDPRITALVLDSSFADMSGVVAASMSRLRLLAFPPFHFTLLHLTDLLTGRRYGYRFDDVQPVEAMPRLAGRPVLLLHSGADRVIPIEHAHRLHAAAGEPTTLTVYPDLDHCGAYFADRPAYIAMVAEFLAEAGASQHSG